MTVLPFPANIPPGINPYAYFARYLEAVFNPRPSNGFKARLIVLFVLTGVGIVLSLAYLSVLIIDHKRRNKSIWLFRLVRRPAGRYMVGNANFLFAIASLVVCGCLVGYIHNFWSVAILRANQDNAFFWRTLIWLPFGAHLWFGSWSSLQAGLLASQAASIPHLLPPIVANTLYIGGLLALAATALTLDIIVSFKWHHVWKLQRRLAIRSILLGGLRPNETAAEAQFILSGALARIDTELGQVVALYRGIGSVYSVASLVILLASGGGLALLFALRRQIRFNTDRSRLEIGGVGEEQPLERPDHSSSPAETPQSLTPRDLAKPEGVFELRAFTAHSSCPTLSNKPRHSPRRPTVHSIHIAQRVEQHSEYLGQDEDVEWEGSTARNLTSEPPISIRQDLARPTGNAPPERRSPQEMQLLALRKVHADVVVFLVAIAALACISLATGLWLAISPTSVYGRFDRIEAVYFVLTWMYLIAVDIALALLLINTLRHLPPARSGQGLHSGRAPDPLPPVLFLPAAADSEDDDERIRDRDRRPFDAFQDEEEGRQGAAAEEASIP
ncbi:hypothetical protein JCM8115_003813 [Rhodotorula mucilaginosa]|uniref:Uncharacterized protein n=1 Tax=Rhodotorula mucilaginosa TaxID=5537 RepID=A0A9P7B2F0_RHOMI|nr:hypothetical protein C6P46_001396 [Rhodotorula mucilaginosa]